MVCLLAGTMYSELWAPNGSGPGHYQNIMAWIHKQFGMIRKQTIYPQDYIRECGIKLDHNNPVARCQLQSTLT